MHPGDNVDVQFFNNSIVRIIHAGQALDTSGNPNADLRDDLMNIIFGSILTIFVVAYISSLLFCKTDRPTQGLL
jgi:hypothetical protein